MEAVDAERKRGEKRLAEDLGDAATEHAVNPGCTQGAHGLRRLKGGNLRDRQAGERIRPGQPAGCAVQRFVGEREDNPRMPPVVDEVLQDFLTLADAAEESKRTGGSR